MKDNKLGYKVVKDQKKKHTHRLEERRVKDKKGYRNELFLVKATSSSYSSSYDVVLKGKSFLCRGIGGLLIPPNDSLEESV